MHVQIRDSTRDFKTYLIIRKSEPDLTLDPNPKYWNRSKVGKLQRSSENKTPTIFDLVWVSGFGIHSLIRDVWFLFL